MAILDGLAQAGVAFGDRLSAVSVGPAAGFQISRNIREKSESLVWSPVSTDVAGQLTQMGILDGLLDLSRSRNLEFLPTFTGLQAGSFEPGSGRFRNGGPLGELGPGRQVRRDLQPDAGRDAQPRL
ncbi:MAG: hypothetical protein OXH75_14420, partial [Acidobacteria bacterium]|nr:hypothetical protein [Acidobacteriota bacterium]